MRLKLAIPLAIAAASAGILLWRVSSPPDGKQPMAQRHATEASEPLPPPNEPQNLQPAAGTGDLNFGNPAMTPDDGAMELTPAFLTQLAVIGSEDTHHSQRTAAVRGLGDALDSAEITALYQFLLKAPPDRRMTRDADRAVKNDLLNLLRNQSTPPGGLTNVMVAMFEDASQDAAVRDYAVQHLLAWYDDAPAEEHPVILEVFADGLQETASSIAGTALISLAALGEEELAAAGLEIDIGGAALGIVESEAASDLARVTAIQISAEENAGGILDAAEEWALDPSASYPCRLAAIAALGKNGSADAAAALARIEALQNPYLRSALAAAKQRLNEDPGTDQATGDQI